MFMSCGTFAAYLFASRSHRLWGCSVSVGKLFQTWRIALLPARSSYQGINMGFPEGTHDHGCLRDSEEHRRFVYTRY